MKKDEFKEFVRNNPHLINYVKKNEMTWQKFYEIYDLYGEDENTWSKYKETPKKDLTGFLKAIDLDAVSEGVNSLQRVVGVLGDLTNKETPKTEYVPRPLYKHFDD